MKLAASAATLLAAANLCLGAAPLYKYVDISAAANASSESGQYALKNFKPHPDKPTYFGEIKFSAIAPGKNSGKNVISFRAGKKQTVSISVPSGARSSTHLYIIHNAGGKLDSKTGAFGAIKLSGGKSFDNFYPKVGIDCGSFAKEELLENARAVYLDDKQAKTGCVYISSFAVNKMSDAVEKIEIESYGKIDWNIYAITFSGKNVRTGKHFTFDPKEWKPVESCREIAEGSALDMTKLMTPAPAGKYGRLVVGKDGHFEFEKRPGKRVKFKGTNDRPGNYFRSNLKTHADIDNFARQYRKLGYNLVRWRISMMGPLEFDAPYKMKPEIRDLYDYLIFALAREGVYSHWDLCSHDLGDPNFKWSDRIDVKCKFIFGDKKTREDWRKLMHMQLDHVNPYTGKAWKDDTSIATTEYFNELDTLYPFHSMLSKEGRDFGDKAFREWIKTRYKTIADLNAAWKLKKPLSSFDEVSPFYKAEHRVPQDVAQFVIHYSRDMQRFCEKVIREEIGFKAPLHQHNCAVRPDVYLLSAEAGTYMAQNPYFMHPSAFMSPGSRVGLTSSLTLDYGGAYWLHAANKRMADRPFFVTEYQHAHWNPFKHEAGVLFPAYSAFQNFDVLTIHDQAVSCKPPAPVSCFEVADSPVYRANEFLSCMLFYRGDVSPAKSRVDIVYDKRYVETSPNMTRGMNHEQAKIAYMTGFAIDFPTARKISDLKDVKVKPADLQMEPVGAAKEVYGNSAPPLPFEKKQYDIAATAKLLREKGIIGEDNISDPAKGVYQSDTGELVLNLAEGSIKVSTPRTEAVVWKKGMKSAKLGRLNVLSSDADATVALTSVDAKPLSDSRRMVLVYNTDNASTGVELSLDRKMLKTRGRLPILVKTGKFSVEIELPKGGFFSSIFSKRQYRVYALKMNGARVQEVPAKIEDGVMRLDIDTAKLEKEPALYYEITCLK